MIEPQALTKSMPTSCAFVWMANENRPQRRGYCFRSRKGSGGGNVAACLAYSSIIQLRRVFKISHPYLFQLIRHGIPANPFSNYSKGLIKLGIVLPGPIFNSECFMKFQILFDRYFDGVGTVSKFCMPAGDISTEYVVSRVPQYPGL